MAEPHDGHMDPDVRELLLTSLRILLATATLLFAYFVFPLKDRDNPGLGLVAVIVALTLVGFVFWRQLRRIRSSNYPILRAAEASVLVALVFIVLMASVATAFSTADADNYSESLSRLDAMYFTITTLATVGFGDITPTAPETRTFTMLQIVLGVALLGVGLRSLVVVAQNVRDERAHATASQSEPEPESE